MSKVKRYTLPLPEPIYNEIQAQAEYHDMTMKEVLKQSLKFGLMAMKVADDPDTDILFRTREAGDLPDSAPVVKETVVQFIM